MQSYQRFQHVGHTAFNTSGTNAPRSLSHLKAGKRSALLKGSHTAAHTAKQGHFRWGCYHYPRTVSHVSETLRGRGLKQQTLPLLGLGWVYFRRTQKAFGTAMRLCVSLFRGVAAPLGCVICLQLGDVAVFFTLCAVLSERARWGWYHYPRSVSHGSETLRGQGVERQTLPLLGLGRGCSQRTQRAFGTAMRLCASLFRGVAAPLGCVIFSVSVEIAACMPCAQGLSVCARRGVVSLPSARFTCC